MMVVFGYQEKKESDIEQVEFLNCANFENIDHAILHYISKNKLSVENLSLSVAGPCEENFINFTNNHWSFDKKDLLSKTNCNSILAINDFAAQGLGFTSLFKTHLNFLDKKILEQNQWELIQKQSEKTKIEIDLVFGASSSLLFETSNMQIPTYEISELMSKGYNGPIEGARLIKLDSMQSIFDNQRQNNNKEKIPMYVHNISLHNNSDIFYLYLR